MKSKRLWIGFAFLTLFALIALLPTIASTKWGFKQLSRLTPGKLQAKSAHFSWLGRQSIEGFRYKSPNTTLTFKSFTTDSSLLTLLLTQRAADTHLIDPKLTLKALPQKGQKAFFLPFKGGVTIQNGELNIGSTDFTNIDVKLHIDQNALPITLAASGKAQGGSFKVGGTIDTGQDSSALSKWLTAKLGLPKDAKLAYQLNADLENFPLLGTWKDALGPSLSLKAEMAANSLSMSAYAKHLTANLSATAPHEDLIFDPGSNIQWQLTPALWKHFKTDLTLTQSLDIDVRLQKVNVPITAPQNTNGHILAKFSNGLIKEAPDTVLAGKINFQTQDISQALDIDLQTTHLNASFTYPKPLDERPNLYALLTKLQAQAKDFPTALLGLDELLGPKLNFDIDSESDLLEINASSSRLNAQKLIFKITPTALNLKQPATVRYTLHHPLFASATPLTAQITQLHLPQNILQMRFAGKIAARQATLKPLAKYGQLQLTDLSLNVTGKESGEMRFSLLSRLGLIGSNGVLKELLGSALDLSGHGRFNYKQKIGDFKLLANGPQSEIKIQSAIEDQTLALTRPIQLKTQLSQKAFNLLKPENLSHVRLTQNAPISIEIEPFKLKLFELNFLTPLQTTLSAKRLYLKTSEPFTLTDFYLGTSSTDQALSITSNGNLDTGSYDLKLTADKSDQAILACDLDCQNISSNLVDSLFKKSPELVQTLGKTFDLNLSIDHSSYKIDLNSAQLNLAGAFNIDDRNRLRALGPVTATYRTSLQSLAKPSIVQIKIDEFQTLLKSRPTLTAPLPAVDWNLSHILIDAKAHADEITFMQNKSLTALYNLDLHLDRSSFSNPLDFELKTSVSTQKNAKAKEHMGYVQIAGTLNDFYDQKGQFSTQNLSTECTAHIKNLPTLLLTPFIPQMPSYFGDHLTATCSAELQNLSGTLYCDVTSPHATFKLDSYISNGNLHLRTPLTASLALTPALSKLFLDDAGLVALSAQKPIQLTLDSKNVSIPMRNFNWQNVRIGTGRLDFGKIIVASQGSAADLIDIFKIRRPSQVTLWFAPLDFTLKNGKMDIQRTEILYDAAYQIATWGRINFLRRYVDMTLGLTAQSLYRALGLRLPPSYVLTIDVQGPFGNVQIDKSAAIAKIALIIADQSGLAPQQGIPGTVFDIIQGFAHDQSSVPPPRPPFPWSH